MKLKYIIPSFMAVVAMLVGCNEDYEAAHLDDLRVSSSFLALSQDGSSTNLVVNAAAKEITADHVTYTDKDGAEHEIPADSVILSVGMRAKTDEALSFYGASQYFYLIGDCKKPGTIQTTNRNAYGVCVNI